MKFTNLFIIFALLLMPSFAISKARSTIITPSKTLLWKQWYTITRNGRRSGYYSETVERDKGADELIIQQKFWEKQGTQLVKSFVQTISTVTAKKTIATYYVKKISPGMINIIEGELMNSQLGVRIHDGNKLAMPELRVMKLTDNTVLASYVPIHLANLIQKGKHKSGKPLTFFAILEEGKDGRFEPSKIEALPIAHTITINGEQCQKINLIFDSINAEWWITKLGKLCRVIIKQYNIHMEMVEESKAKSFL